MTNTSPFREFFWRLAQLRAYARVGWWKCAEARLPEVGELALRLSRDWCEAIRELAGALKDGNHRRFGKLVERWYRYLGWADPELAEMFERDRRQGFALYEYLAAGGDPKRYSAPRRAG